MRALNTHQRNPTHRITASALLRQGLARKREFGLLLAESGGTVAGFALHVGAYESAWLQHGLFIEDLYVRPDMRRRGVARALIAATAHEARCAGGTYVWCAARLWNRAAQAAYRALGASEGRVMVYDWAGRSFARLAREGAKITTPRGRGSKRHR